MTTRDTRTALVGCVGAHRVKDVADGVLDELVVGEGAMAALVRRHPRACRRSARRDGVRHPRPNVAHLAQSGRATQSLHRTRHK
eukprot:5042798-Pyramimonas_sp.AAC.1